MSGMRGNRLTRFHHAIQLAFAVFLNGYAAGMAGGSPCAAASKTVCVPVLNCHSCPGALGACPIGMLQASLGGAGRHFPFYVLGSIAVFGVLVGRLVCGFVCPFGFIQDLLYKVPVPKCKVAPRVDRVLRYVKYLMLFGLVIGASVAFTTEYGTTPPFFCEFICPAGTLEAGIPLLLADEGLRGQAGGQFVWKAAVLLAILVGSTLVHRPFCKYLCPLGAFYGLFNKFSFYRMAVDHEACSGCGTCAKRCPMGVDPARTPNSAECIRCGACRAACPKQAIATRWEWSTNPEETVAKS